VKATTNNLAAVTLTGVTGYVELINNDYTSSLQSPLAFLVQGVKPSVLACDASHATVGGCGYCNYSSTTDPCNIASQLKQCVEATQY